MFGVANTLVVKGMKAMTAPAPKVVKAMEAPAMRAMTAMKASSGAMIASLLPRPSKFGVKEEQIV